MKKDSREIMIRVSEFIVDKRRAFYFFFAIAVIFSVISIPKVKVNNDITSYLPDETETRQGLNIMESEFTTYNTVKLMISNITYEGAEKQIDKIKAVKGVKDVEFDDTEDHFKDSSALFTITLEPEEDLDKNLEIMDNMKASLEGYDVYIYSDTIDDSSKTLEKEMNVILLLALAVIVVVLLFTSESFMEVPVFLIVFAVAALLNMGTNYWMGEISFITKSVAVVLQLALAIDYSIILCHRFAEEKKDKNAHDAIVAALSKAIIEISSSSLTTISGLAALMIMQLRIGMDMGLVLCKGILFSLVAVFLLMPGLLLMCSNLIDKTMHKSFVPDITPWCKLVMKLRYIVPVIFGVVIVFCIYFSSNCDYAFDATAEQNKKVTERSIAVNKITGIFGQENTLAVIVPKGDHDKEAKVIELVKEQPLIKTALGLSNVEIKDGYTLTQKINAREFSEIADIDYELSRLLFQAYGASNEQFGALFNEVSEYKVSIIDIFLFAHEQIDLGIVNLDADKTKDINDLYETLTDAQKQLEGDNYARMVFTYTSDIEAQESYQLLEDIREDVKRYYDNPVLASNTTNSMDLRDSFKSDNNKISIATILAVLIILMFTFKSTGIPVILVLTIQGSIWINFSFPYLTGSRLYFLGYLVVSSIQMGATIDYAIVFTNRYMQLREDYDHKTAAMKALNGAFPTVLTSGSIMTIAGFLIGKQSTNAIISSLGISLGRGTLISIILVMLVLPQIMMFSDKIIEKSSFAVKEKKVKEATGLVYVNGRVRGYINGYIDASVQGFIRGDVQAKMEIGEKSQVERKESKE